MAGIFISYRRDDAAPWAGRVYERLAQDFKRDQIFMDVDNIAPGLDFVRELERQVGQCNVLIAVIGKDWTRARNAKGQRRLDDPRDFVRIELESALERDIRVIPVLVDGAGMPLADELPEKLQPLTRRNAIELTHARFGSDVQRLVSAVAPIVRRTGVGRSHRPVEGIRVPTIGSPERVRSTVLVLAGLLSALTAVIWANVVIDGNLYERPVFWLYTPVRSDTFFGRVNPIPPPTLFAMGWTLACSWLWATFFRLSNQPTGRSLVLLATAILLTALSLYGWWMTIREVANMNKEGTAVAVLTCNALAAYLWFRWHRLRSEG
jgi:hypothetical protein